MSTSRSKKMLEDVHPLNIIKEVQKWPVLYQRNNPERLNYNFKTKIWYEAAKNLVPDWEQLSDSEKEVKVTELGKKWRNLRDTFRRHAEAERRAPTGAGRAARSRRPYVYFKHMLFLLPHVAPDESERPEQLPMRPRPTASHKRQDRKRPREEVSAASPLEPIDEDRHFLMSLIPSFKKMSDDEKLTAKVEILKVIQQVRSTTVNTDYSYRDLVFVEECGTGGGPGLKTELEPENSDDDSDQSTGSASPEVS